MASAFDNPSAYEPMYDDAIVIRGSRGASSKIETTVSACVLSCSYGDPISEDAVEAVREEIIVSVRDDDWRYLERMRRGDVLSWRGRDYAYVSARHDVALGWTVKAREAAS